MSHGGDSTITQAVVLKEQQSHTQARPQQEQGGLPGAERAGAFTHTPLFPTLVVTGETKVATQNHLTGDSKGSQVA